jgi:hypothetical protein
MFEMDPTSERAGCVGLKSFFERCGDEEFKRAEECSETVDKLVGCDAGMFQDAPQGSDCQLGV